MITRRSHILIVVIGVNVRRAHAVLTPPILDLWPSLVQLKDEAITDHNRFTLVADREGEMRGGCHDGNDEEKRRIYDEAKRYDCCSSVLVNARMKMAREERQVSQLVQKRKKKQTYAPLHIE
jgi:hypothetical protein